VVDVRGECCDDEEVLRRHGVVLLSLPTQDRCAVSQRMLDDGVRWVVAQLDAGHRVHIHCEYGIGRSALLALCVLAARGEDPLEALRTVKRARWKVSPSPEQLGGFRTWLERHGMAAPPLQPLFEIAYAHLRTGDVGTGTAAG
jgi:protein-tyrosine phosphatase